MIFKDKVYEVAKKIPKGKVATYGQLARLAGNPKASRAVGLLMKNNPYYPAVSCHRVVGFDGRLTGYTGGHGVSTKKKMLLDEGVKFAGEKVDLEKSLWKE
jgi:methylated-DNA-protein-cysteine methyltransferase related protein